MPAGRKALASLFTEPTSTMNLSNVPYEPAALKTFYEAAKVRSDTDRKRELRSRDGKTVHVHAGWDLFTSSEACKARRRNALVCLTAAVTRYVQDHNLVSSGKTADQTAGDYLVGRAATLTPGNVGRFGLTLWQVDDLDRNLASDAAKAQAKGKASPSHQQIAGMPLAGSPGAQRHREGVHAHSAAALAVSSSSSASSSASSAQAPSSASSAATLAPSAPANMSLASSASLAATAAASSLSSESPLPSAAASASSSAAGAPTSHARKTVKVYRHGRPVASSRAAPNPSEAGAATGNRLPAPALPVADAAQPQVQRHSTTRSAAPLPLQPFNAEAPVGLQPSANASLAAFPPSSFVPSTSALQSLPSEGAAVASGSSSLSSSLPTSVRPATFFSAASSSSASASGPLASADSQPQPDDKAVPGALPVRGVHPLAPPPAAQVFTIQGLGAQYSLEQLQEAHGADKAKRLHERLMELMAIANATQRVAGNGMPINRAVQLAAAYVCVAHRHPHLTAADALITFLDHDTAGIARRIANTVVPR